MTTAAIHHSDIVGFCAPEIDIDLIRRLDRNGPRYTSYPTADRFVEAFDANAYVTRLHSRATCGIPQPLSLYVHIPFCSNICYYCACNKVITKDQARASKYLRYLLRELKLQAAQLSGDRTLDQLHWGGGTPTFLTIEQMTELMDAIRSHFTLHDHGEYSIEIDPRHADAATISALVDLGFNRISIGVQDFDPVVQAAVNRIQSEDETRVVIDAARAKGIRSISLDLIYGLPHQTVESFERTLDRVLDMAPDRLSLYSYAHLPQLFKPQRRIDDKALPAPEMKLAIMQRAVEKLTAAGYVYIGMDHFAKPEDELAIAQRQGRLHRNFQGYSTHADCDLLAIGVSAIGKIGPSYSQNFRTLDDYYDALDRDTLPIMRGLELTADDLLRRTIIQSLMCQFEIAIHSFEIAYLIDFKRYFADELVALREYEREGLLSIDNEAITVSDKGRFLIRPICMTFDRYLRQDQERQRYSKVI